MHNKILQILFPFCSDDKEMLFVSGCGGCSGGIGDVVKSCCRITRRFGVNTIRDKCKHTKLQYMYTQGNIGAIKAAAQWVEQHGSSWLVVWQRTNNSCQVVEQSSVVGCGSDSNNSMFFLAKLVCTFVHHQYMQQDKTTTTMRRR